MDGKSLRLARLLDPDSGRITIVPIDHGTTLGPVNGLENVSTIIRNLVQGGADAIVVHKGILSSIVRHDRELCQGRYLMHLSVSTSMGPDQTNKVLVSTVEEGVALGADGISMHVNLAVDSEASMIRDLGNVAGECMRWGMPLLAMVYPHTSPTLGYNIAHGARLAQELGADIIKIPYPATTKEAEEILDGVIVPVVFAGGSKSDDPTEILRMVSVAIKVGAAGVAVGRNIFQHDEPKLITKLISGLVHERMHLEECLVELNGKVHGELETAAS